MVIVSEGNWNHVKRGLVLQIEVCKVINGLRPALATTCYPIFKFDYAIFEFFLKLDSHDSKDVYLTYRRRGIT